MCSSLGTPEAIVKILEALMLFVLCCSAAYRIAKGNGAFSLRFLKSFIEVRSEGDSKKSKARK